MIFEDLVLPDALLSIGDKRSKFMEKNVYFSC